MLMRTVESLQRVWPAHDLTRVIAYLSDNDVARKVLLMFFRDRVTSTCIVPHILH
jgi:hypothetical protein